jgi:hypothetical protein
MINDLFSRWEPGSQPDIEQETLPDDATITFPNLQNPRDFDGNGVLGEFSYDCVGHWPPCCSRSYKVGASIYQWFLTDVQIFQAAFPEWPIGFISSNGELLDRIHPDLPSWVVRGFSAPSWGLETATEAKLLPSEPRYFENAIAKNSGLYLQNPEFEYPISLWYWSHYGIRPEDPLLMSCYSIFAFHCAFSLLRTTYYNGLCAFFPALLAVGKLLCSDGD